MTGSSVASAVFLCSLGGGVLEARGAVFFLPCAPAPGGLRRSEGLCTPRHLPETFLLPGQPRE